MKIVLLAAAMAASVTAAPASAGTYSALYVFGDSLVDSGNDYIATSGAQPPASGGYNAGRFSNGYNAADYLNFALFGSYSAPELGGGTNYAFGGALAASDANGIPDLADQVGF